jgi:hypothetical protein
MCADQLLSAALRRRSSDETRSSRMGQHRNVPKELLLKVISRKTEYSSSGCWGVGGQYGYR